MQSAEPSAALERVAPSALRRMERELRRQGWEVVSCRGRCRMPLQFPQTAGDSLYITFESVQRSNDAAEALSILLLVPHARYGLGNYPYKEQKNPEFHGASRDRERWS